MLCTANPKEVMSSTPSRTIRSPSSTISPAITSCDGSAFDGLRFRLTRSAMCSRGRTQRASYGSGSVAQSSGAVISANAVGIDAPLGSVNSEPFGSIHSAPNARNHSPVGFLAGNGTIRQSRARVSETYRSRWTSSIAEITADSPTDDAATRSANGIPVDCIPNGQGQ